MGFVWVHPCFGVGVVLSAKKKLLSCLFWSDVLCSFRLREQFAVMDRCLECPHYFRFMREIEEEDERVMDEIDRIRKYGFRKRFDVGKGVLDGFS
jgi:hypothetical protein